MSRSSIAGSKWLLSLVERRRICTSRRQMTSSTPAPTSNQPIKLAIFGVNNLNENMVADMTHDCNYWQQRHLAFLRLHWRLWGRERFCFSSEIFDDCASLVVAHGRYLNLSLGKNNTAGTTPFSLDTARFLIALIGVSLQQSQSTGRSILVWKQSCQCH